GFPPPFLLLLITVSTSGPRSGISDGGRGLWTIIEGTGTGTIRDSWLRHVGGSSPSHLSEKLRLYDGFKEHAQERRRHGPNRHAGKQQQDAKSESNQRHPAVRRGTVLQACPDLRQLRQDAAFGISSVFSQSYTQLLDALVRHGADLLERRDDPPD